MAAPLMPPRRTGGKPPGKGGGLSKPSIGGLPLWAVIIGGAVAVFAAYKIYKNYQAGSGSSTATSPTSPTDTTGSTGTDTSGGGASGSGDTSGSSPTDLTPVEDLANSIYALIPFLGGGTLVSPPSSVVQGNPPNPSPAASPPIPGVQPVPGQTVTRGTAANHVTPSPTAIFGNAPPITFAPANPTPKGTPLPASAFSGVAPSVGGFAGYPVLNLTPPTPVAAPAHSATAVSPTRAPVAGTTSNRNATQRSRTLH